MGSTSTHITPTTKRIAAMALLVALGGAACGSDDDAGATATVAPAIAADRAGADGGGDAVATAATAEGQPATGGVDATGAPIDLTFGRDLVVTAGVTMVTPDVRTAVDDIIGIAARNGGAVFNANVTVEDPLDDGSVPGGGTIVIRVPPAQLDLLIADLRGVGTLRNQTQSVDDVTDRLIDLDIQIRQAFESVERMEAILTETTDFDSLVAAETELVRRQTAYERLLAAQRTIDDRVALSTLTVTVQYRSPAVEDTPVADDGDRGIADALRDGWDAFAGVLFGLAFVLAISAPFLGVALVLVAIAWLASRRLRRRQEIMRNRHEPLDDPTERPLPTPPPIADDGDVTGVELADASRPD